MVKEKIKQKTEPKLTKQILCDSDFKSCLEGLHKLSVAVTIDKATNNFALISKLYAEVGLFNSKSKAHSEAAHFLE